MSYVALFNAPNNLRKAKIGEGKGKLDPAIIQRAEKAVERIQRNHTEWADEDLGALEATLAKLGARQGRSDGGCPRPLPNIPRHQRVGWQFRLLDDE